MQAGVVVQEVESTKMRKKRENWMKQDFGIGSGSWVGLGGSGTGAGE